MAVSTEIHCETRLNRLPEKSFGQINQPFLPRPATFNRPPFPILSGGTIPLGKPSGVSRSRASLVFFVVRIYYRKIAIYQGFCRIVAVRYCVTPYTRVGIFCQTLPLTMKNISQNTASGGRAAKGNFRQHEIRGQRCQRGRFSSNHFSVVRIYYLKNANYQGFCPDLPVKFCSILATSRRKFLPNLSIDDEKQESKPCKSKAMARLEELKHSVSTVAAHKNRMDARIVFDGRPPRNRFLFPWLPSAHCGGNSKTHFVSF